MIDPNLAYVRFLRKSSLLAAQTGEHMIQLGSALGELATALSSSPGASDPLALLALPKASPESLVRGPRQKAVVALLKQHGEEGLESSKIAPAIGVTSVPNANQGLRRMMDLGILEPVPDSMPRRWRLVERYR